MPSCAFIDPLVTPYVDGEIAASDRTLVDQHIRVCPPCRSRVAAEQAVRTLIQGRKPALTVESASGTLRARCLATRWAAGQSESAGSRPSRDGALRDASAAADLSKATRSAGATRDADAGTAGSDATDTVPWNQRSVWRARVVPVVLAAALVLIVAGSFLYRLTESSTRVLAAELAADHVKCFALNALARPSADPVTVQQSMAAGFNWQMEVPQPRDPPGLQLVGSRPCLYAEGKVAHIMYRHEGRPVSVFMLPGTHRAEALVHVLGHAAVVWSAGDRTFVVIGRESEGDMNRLASVVRAELR